MNKFGHKSNATDTFHNGFYILLGFSLTLIACLINSLFTLLYAHR